MQTTNLHLRPAVPIEFMPASVAEDFPPDMSPSSLMQWGKVGTALAAATVLAACGGGEKVYTPSNLASAPHDAIAELPVGTVVVFEEFEDRDCKSRAIDRFAATVMLGAVASPKSKPTKTDKSSSPKPVPTCEGAETQVEACQTGGTPDSDPSTTGQNCVHIDLKPGDFAAATGHRTIHENEVLTLARAVRGVVDRD